MRTRDYEAMFLLNNDAAIADFDGTAGQVDHILERAGAKIVQKEKWDERKLAYEIGGHKRATYYLTYFRAPTDAPAKIAADADAAASRRAAPRSKQQSPRAARPAPARPARWPWC